MKGEIVPLSRRFRKAAPEVFLQSASGVSGARNPSPQRNSPEAGHAQQTLLDADDGLETATAMGNFIHAPTSPDTPQRQYGVPPLHEENGRNRETHYEKTDTRYRP